MQILSFAFSSLRTKKNSGHHLNLLSAYKNMFGLEAQEQTEEIFRSQTKYLFWSQVMHVLLVALDSE